MLANRRQAASDEQLKGAAVCIRLYRNQLARQVKTVEIIKAAASSGATAGWFASDSYKFEPYFPYKLLVLLMIKPRD